MPFKLPFVKKTTEERLRQHQQTLRRVQLILGKDQNVLKSKENREIAKIRRIAKQGKMDEVKIMAKDLVMTRRSVKKVILMRENIQAMKHKVETLELNEALADAMKKLKKVLDLSRELRFLKIQKILMKLEGNDVMGDVDEDKSDAIVSQVLDELGLQLTDELSGLPSTGQSLGVANKAKAPQAAAAGGGGPPSDADADLEARLENLRRQ